MSNSWVNGNIAVSSYTAPSASFITTADAKLWMKVDATEDDTLIAKLILSAIRSAEHYMWRALGVQTIKLYLTDWPQSLIIYLNRCPYKANLTVKYYNNAGTLTTLALNTDYKVKSDIEPPLIKMLTTPNLNGDEPFPIEVTWDAGYADYTTIPEDIRTGILNLISFMYENRQMEVKMLPLYVTTFLDDYRVKVY